jgi:protease IV
MKQFFKFMFASMLGFILTLVILFFLFLAMVASFIAMADNDNVDIQDKTVLLVKLDKPVLDRAPKSPLSFFNSEGFDFEVPPGLDEILKNIEKAKTDNRISGIYLDLSMVPSGIAIVEEIRNALLDFKSSGKFIIAYGEMYSQLAYYLATAADKVYLNPDGMIDFKGLAAESMFLKGTLEKLDIEIQVIRHGKYKSAAEMFMMDKLSDFNREQLQAYIDDVWTQMLQDIAAKRGISVDALETSADNLDGMVAEKAKEMKLVDDLYYKDQLMAEFRQLLGLGENDEMNTVTLGKYTNVADPVDKKYSRDRIAVIYALGSIGDGKGDDQTIGSQRLSKAIHDARTNDKVKAIVMRVNSPGGSALASEVIRREVELAAAEKPFVVSMSDLAASGGYWISCTADKIVADPMTLTGSIGVFGIFPNFGKFFSNKLGITFDITKTNENSDFPNVTRPLPEYQQKVMEREVEHIYGQFLALVSEGRKLPVAMVDSLGQGRIWSAVDAKQAGLVDELGGLKRSIELAAEIAGITEYSISSLPEQKDPWQEIIDQLTGEARVNALKAEMGEFYSYYRYLSELKEMNGIQARLPFSVTIE